MGRAVRAPPMPPPYAQSARGRCTHGSAMTSNSVDLQSSLGSSDVEAHFIVEALFSVAFLRAFVLYFQDFFPLSKNYFFE